VSAREPCGELGDGAFAECASNRCGALQRQGCEVSQGSQKQRRPERVPPPRGAGTARVHQPRRLKLRPRRRD
jgi:hypothetical protein